MIERGVGRHRLPSPIALVQPVPSLLLIVGAVAVLAESLAIDPRLARFVAAMLPVDVAAPDPAVAVASAVGLAALAVALHRGKRLAWWLAIVTFSSGLIAQSLLLGHPIGAAVAAACLLFLAGDRVQYRTRCDGSWRRRFVLLLAIGLAAAMVESLVTLLASGEWQSESFDVGDFLAGAISWFAFGDPSSTVPVGPGFLLALLPLVARLPVVLGLLGVLRPAEEQPLEPQLRAHATGVAQRFGHGALLPFQLGPDKLQHSIPGADGTVVYGRAGRTAVVLGDPIGPEPDAWRVFDSFLEQCALDDLVPAVYQASPASRPRLIRAGFRCFQVGREAIVDLATFSLAGSARANLRHTVTRARRGGVSVRWFGDGIQALASETIGELVEIDRAWRSQSGPEMGFTIGRFDATELAGVPAAIAFGADGHVLAFATFRSTGIDGGWVLDLIRRLPGGVPGAVEACIVEAAERLRDAGCGTLSLGLAPLAGLRREAGPIEERLLAASVGLVRPMYDVSGLEFFKSKFDPIWQPRYAAVRRRRDLLGLVAGLIRLHVGTSSGGLVAAARQAAALLLAGKSRSASRA